MRLAIYDLDRTLTAAPTFTPFLAFAARHTAPWRLALLPVWVAAMLWYRAGLCSRTALKAFGMRWLAGAAGTDRLAALGVRFARQRIARPGLNRGVMALVEEDRAAGARLLVATAAFAFYAQAFADALGFSACIGTRWDGRAIPGGNCYGAQKLARVEAWLADQGLARAGLVIRFVSDSFADAPMLDWADEPLFVTASPAEARRAAARGWRVINPAG